MIVKPRDTKKRVEARRITAPETRIDEHSGKKIPLLSYIDAGSYQRNIPTTKEIFLYAAGSNEEGEVSEALDRLIDHRYQIHLNENGKAVGIDVIPSRLYRSRVIPASQLGVKNLTLQYDADGAVVRVAKRPHNLRFDQSAAVIAALDAIIKTGKQITVGMRVGNLGRVVSVTENSVELSLTGRTRQQLAPQAEDDDFVDDEVDNDHDDAGESMVP